MRFATMVKFKKILTSLFPKSSSKLETDASIIPRRSDPTNVESDKIELQSNELCNVGNEAAITIDTPGSSSDQSLIATSVADPDVLSRSIVNNVQNNNLVASQTSITNAPGIQIYQIKNTRNIHIGDTLTIYTGEDRTKSSSVNGSVRWENLKLSGSIKHMIESNDDMDTEMMGTISRHLGYEWKSFARFLQYSQGQIEAFECDYPTLSEQIYHFVLDWTRNDDEPTLGKIVKLLWEQKHKETVYHMKVLWKKRKSSPD
ncbi:protein immune deficiency [Malaya genurostris]|uniref:protein immune deficiency n=1 Tax=Malaya genurostris TaxID=325434 RepID=UPI0026F387A4|nr:protein immune deficiency [Malaya genurostris]XP_058460861.1 protein immune deficiency [Malaya genurostris]